VNGALGGKVLYAAHPQRTIGKGSELKKGSIALKYLKYLAHRVAYELNIICPSTSSSIS